MTYEKPFWRAGRGPPPSRYTNTGVEYRNEEDPEDYEGVVNLGEQYQARCTSAWQTIIFQLIAVLDYTWTQIIVWLSLAWSSA